MTKDFNDSASFSNNKNKEVLYIMILHFKLNCKIFLHLYVGLLKHKACVFFPLSTPVCCMQQYNWHIQFIHAGRFTALKLNVMPVDLVKKKRILHNIQN